MPLSSGVVKNSPPQGVGREVYGPMSSLNKKRLSASDHARTPRALLVQSTTNTVELLTGQPSTM
jgi:hypothetical protein